jgi:hypothetical protein
MDIIPERDGDFDGYLAHVAKCEIWVCLCPRRPKKLPHDKAYKLWLTTGKPIFHIDFEEAAGANQAFLKARWKNDKGEFSSFGPVANWTIPESFAYAQPAS